MDRFKGEEVHHKTIMVIDDDKIMREMLERFLTVSGYNVCTAPNGIKLISNLKVNKPDLILLDVMMSWVNGFELCRIMKASDDFKDIPVIFISGCNTKEDLEKGFAAGCADYFTKPFDNFALLERIQSLLGEGPKTAQEGRL